MTPRPSIVGRIAESRWWANATRRRIVMIVLALILALLTVFPRNYRAAASLAPQNAATAGISNVAGALGAGYTSLLANYLPVEIDLAVTRSINVRRAVYNRLKLGERSGWRDQMGALRKLESKVHIRALRANIIEISAKDHDPDFALALVQAFSEEGQAELERLSLEQTRYKRRVLDNRVEDAVERLAVAQDNFNNFRRRQRMADPGEQLGLASARITLVKTAIQDKEIELAIARRFQTDENMKVKTIISELAQLRGQLREVQTLSEPGDEQTVEGAVAQTTEFNRLQRRLTFAQGLYDAYTRSLEGTALEQLTADFNMRYLERPYIDPDFVPNLIPLALLILLLAFGGAAEAYMLRPPVGAYREAGVA